MDKKERAALIRKGNELFNCGKINEAITIFARADYRDGLARIGDYYFYEKKQPLIAFKFYKKANNQKKMNEIFERMIFALSKWIGEDKESRRNSNQPVKLPPVKVSPKLKILAEEILRKNNKE